MMEASSVNDTSKIQLAGSKSEIEEEFVYSPIQDLDLLVDGQDPKDKNELNMILAGILNYPSDTLAEHHTEAMRLGNFDLEAESKKAHETIKAQSAANVYQS